MALRARSSHTVHQAHGCVRRICVLRSCEVKASSGGDSTGPSAKQGISWLPRPLDVSRRLARARLTETQQIHSLVKDPHAEALARTSPPGSLNSSVRDLALDIIATKHVDEMLINAVSVTSMNTIAEGDYRQVVLVGDGLDTRPFRLLWPTGTLFFLLAPSETHELAEAVLRQNNVVVQRGCLLRRVDADLQRSGGDWVTSLAHAGFRLDRVSVWALQGLSGLNLPPLQLTALLTEIADCAAYNSLVLGELPGASCREVENRLAQVGLLGAVQAHAELAVEYGRWQAECNETHDAGSVSKQEIGQVMVDGVAENGTGWDSGLSGRWLFVSQQQRLSVRQTDMYVEHVAGAEAVDEDLGNTFFS